LASLLGTAVCFASSSIVLIHVWLLLCRALIFLAHILPADVCGRHWRALVPRLVVNLKLVSSANLWRVGDVEVKLEIGLRINHNQRWLVPGLVPNQAVIL
jgi:hypothetical protein